VADRRRGDRSVPGDNVESVSEQIHQPDKAADTEQEEHAKANSYASQDSLHGSPAQRYNALLRDASEGERLVCSSRLLGDVVCATNHRPPGLPVRAVARGAEDREQRAIDARSLGTAPSAATSG
jgi:hypothetical protein